MIDKKISNITEMRRDRMITLTESELRTIVNESVKKIVSEISLHKVKQAYEKANKEAKDFSLPLGKRNLRKKQAEYFGGDGFNDVANRNYGVSGFEAMSGEPSSIHQYNLGPDERRNHQRRISKAQDDYLHNKGRFNKKG